MLGIIQSLYEHKGRPLRIGFSGAGGKTTSLYWLAETLLNMQQKVIITTTTKMYIETQNPKFAIVIRETFSEDDLNHSCGWQWFSSSTDDGKGLAPTIQAVEELNKYTDMWKLIEIDGSKHRPVKAPEVGEPVYAEGLDLVLGVIGASVVGKPATDEWVHRLEAFLEVTGAEYGETITVNHLVKLIVCPKGLFKGLPPNTVGCVLLTQVKETDCQWVAELRGQIHYPLEVIPWQDSLYRKQ